MGTTPGPDWRRPSGQEEWIAERLAPFGDYVVASVVPGGFEAYARILHPATDPLADDPVVRWAEVAAWSGMPLDRGAQFHSIALPPRGPGGPVPWESPPLQGSLYPPDAEALATTLRGWTRTPQRCWFCVRAWLERGTGHSHPVLRTESVHAYGGTSGTSHPLYGVDLAKAREEVSGQLVYDLIGLVER